MFTVQRFRLIALTVLSILGLTIIGAAFLSPAYAVCTLTTTQSSYTITQGTSGFTISGSDLCDPAITTSVDANLYPGACPASGSLILDGGVNTASDKSFAISSFTSPISSLPTGTYCFYVFSVVSPTTNFVNDPLTVTSSAPPIPEYPVGLAILAVFMVIGYGLIRRKTTTQQR
ncbi:MAG: hypothetical protein ABSF63_11665 [Candidatus Bathyarchaeia archaeon]